MNIKYFRYRSDMLRNLMLLLASLVILLCGGCKSISQTPVEIDLTKPGIPLEIGETAIVTKSDWSILRMEVTAIDETTITGIVDVINGKEVPEKEVSVSRTEIKKVVTGGPATWSNTRQFFEGSAYLFFLILGPILLLSAL